MKRFCSHPPSLLIALAALVLSYGVTWACTIPVFRYALDRWEADPLVLEIPQSLASTPEIRNLLRPIRAGSPANLQIREIKGKGKSAALLTAHGQTPVWSGELNEHTLAQLLDSPARKRIHQAILDGQSVIWVIVEHDSDAAAKAKTLQQRLNFLEQVAALPPQDPNDPDSRLGPGPELRLDFAVHRVQGDDPAEAAFIQMLAGPLQHLVASKTSFAAAVFGRGRVLAAIPLADLDHQTLEEATLFLVGKCSCEVKNQNPGWDFVMNVDWPTDLEKVALARAELPTPPLKPRPIMKVATPSRDAASENPPTNPSSPAKTAKAPAVPPVSPPSPPQAPQALSTEKPIAKADPPPTKATPPKPLPSDPEPTPATVVLKGKPPPLVASPPKDPLVFLPGPREFSWATLGASLILVLGAGSAWVRRGPRPTEPPAPPPTTVPPSNAPSLLEIKTSVASHDTGPLPPPALIVDPPLPPLPTEGDVQPVPADHDPTAESVTPLPSLPDAEAPDKSA